MKNHLLILLCSIFLISGAGCKKKSFDPTTKSQEDFIGTWKGGISTFKNNQLLKEYGTMVIYPNGTNSMLSGILFMTETSVFHEFQFVDGTLYFKVDNNDPENPTCQNWSLGGFAEFSEEGKLDITITGNECGQHGNEFVNWVGSMSQYPVSQDSLKYFNFAKTGNSWTYTVTLKDGTSCQVQKQISSVSSSYIFNGAISQTCGWSGQTRQFNWNVNPAGFSIINDSSLSIKPIAFPINAKPGVVYSTFLNNDTITVTLLDTNYLVTTPAGDFTCFRYRYTEPDYADSLKVTKTAYLWLNNRYGIIKQEVVNPVDSTDIQLQVLSSKSF
jgi:hypothetical protein